MTPVHMRPHAVRFANFVQRFVSASTVPCVPHDADFGENDPFPSHRFADVEGFAEIPDWEGWPDVKTNHPFGSNHRNDWVEG